MTKGPDRLADFTASPRMIVIAGVAAVIGVMSAFVALALLRLIALFTNVFFFHDFSFTNRSPADNPLGAGVILVPIVGSLIVGFMARYGSERIRGHGIPEALEAILVGGSRLEPRVAVLKPLSSAISIGSGGPFGAEGPIIMTGGAFGSIVAQLLEVTSAERKTLLVAGAAGGMAATFASPIAAMLLAVELLLFEWKPRSFVPVAVACVAAEVTRHSIIGPGPLFPVPPHPAFIGGLALLECVIAGLLAGALSAALTLAVYASEDLFKRLPIHWMWWPPLGGLAVGLAGVVCPRSLGIGYDTIGTILRGALPWKALALLLVVKGLAWATSLGSGTSGGVLAPLLMMGGALGGIEALAFAPEGAGFWPLVSMGAVLGGTMRSPFTAVVFAVELTHDVNMLVPLMVAVVVSHAFTVLTLRRSILTEKVARRGFHLSREYAVDPLEVLFVRDVMMTSQRVFSVEDGAMESSLVIAGRDDVNQELFAVVDAKDAVVGAVTRGEIALASADPERKARRLGDLVKPAPWLAFADESLRAAVHRMARVGATRLLVVSGPNSNTLVGQLTLANVLAARARHLEEETRRERTLVWQAPSRFLRNGRRRAHRHEGSIT